MRRSRDETEGIDVRRASRSRDPVLEALFACMRCEVDSGCTSGQPVRRRPVAGAAGAAARVLRQRRGAPSRAPSRKLSTRQLQDAIAFIDANIGADLSLASLARQLSMSPSTFAKLFKASVGAPTHRFVLSRRLQRAEILLNSDASLSEIALAVGFASQSHFTEAFRRRTGRTPSRARRQADATPPSPAPLLAGVAGRRVDRAGATVGRLLRIRAEQLARARVGRLERDRCRRGAVLDPVGQRREQLPRGRQRHRVGVRRPGSRRPCPAACRPRAVAHPGDHEQAVVGLRLGEAAVEVGDPRVVVDRVLRRDQRVGDAVVLDDLGAAVLAPFRSALSVLMLPKNGCSAIPCAKALASWP